MAFRFSALLATPMRAAAVGAGLWVLAHLLIHVPRGWPFPVAGDWDVLLPALALAGGAELPSWRGGLAAHEAGLLLLVWLVSMPLRLGVDPVVLARVLALGFGALTAGSVAALTHLLVDREPGRAALGAALVVAGTLPGWHQVASGLHASTPEATALALCAVALAAAGGTARAVVAGLLVGLALVLSPVVAPAVVLLLALTDARRAALAAFVVTLLAAPLLTSGQAAASGTWLILVASGGGAALEAALTLPGRALGAAAAGLGASALLGAFTLVALGASAWCVTRGDRRRWLGVGVLLSLLVALVPPPAYAEYPTAYRYWQPALLLAAGCFGAAVAALPGRLALVVASVPILLFALGPGRLVADRVDTLSESVFAAAIHRMGPNPRGSHGTFRELAPFAPAATRPAFALGYGLMLGHRASAAGLTAPFDHPRWPDLLEAMGDPHAARGLAIGAGYGLVAPCPVRSAQRAAIGESPRGVREAIYYGVNRALAERPGPLELVVPSEDHDRVVAMVGDAARAAGRPWAEVEQLGYPEELLARLERGYRRPGGGLWETRLVSELPQLQPSGPCPSE